MGKGESMHDLSKTGSSGGRQEKKQEDERNFEGSEVGDMSKRRQRRIQYREE